MIQAHSGSVFTPLEATVRDAIMRYVENEYIPWTRQLVLLAAHPPRAKVVHADDK